MEIPSSLMSNVKQMPLSALKDFQILYWRECLPLLLLKWRAILMLRSLITLYFLYEQISQNECS